MGQLVPFFINCYIDNWVNLLKEIEQQINVDYAMISKEELLDALDKKFFLMLDEEIRFYEDMVSRTRHSKQVVEDILEFYRDLDHIINNELNPDNQSIIRFGKGSGFNSTTYNLSLDENNRARIASRTISEDFSPMGWAVIEFQEK